MLPEALVSARPTVGGVVDAATRRFAAVGIGSPRREAIHLVADLLDLEATGLLWERDGFIEPERRRSIDRAVERRALGEPLAYVGGLAGFRRLVLRCDRRALIPRPESEGLVDRVLAIESGGVVADVGTGTGCLALSLRQEGSYRCVVATDQSRDALALAAVNVHRTGLPVSLVRGVWSRPLGDDSVDLLVSNPPYLSVDEHRDLDPSVREYEPAAALVSGPDGLAATRELLRDGRRVVRPGGAVVLEVATARAEATAALANALGWTGVRVDDDIFGRARYLVARREETGA